MDVCSAKEPPVLDERDHLVACWWANDHAFETVPMEVYKA
jgi:hypothetical protein